jgi:hypothetical protein
MKALPKEIKEYILATQTGWTLDYIRYSLDMRDYEIYTMFAEIDKTMSEGNKRTRSALAPPG